MRKQTSFLQGEESIPLNQSVTADDGDFADGQMENGDDHLKGKDRVLEEQTIFDVGSDMEDDEDDHKDKRKQ